MAKNDPDNLGEQLSAYLDGELNDADRAAVEAMLRDSADARAELENLRATASMIEQLPRAGASPALVGDVMAIIERRQLLGDQPVDPPPGRPASGRLKMLLSVAAMIGLSVSAGIWGLLYSAGNVEQPPLVDARSRANSEGHEVGNASPPAMDSSLLAKVDGLPDSFGEKDVALDATGGTALRAGRLKEQPDIAATPNPTVESNETRHQSGVSEESKQSLSVTTGATVAEKTRVESQPRITDKRDTSLALAPQARDSMNQAVAGDAFEAGAIPQSPSPAATAAASAPPELQKKFSRRGVQQAPGSVDLQLVITCRDLDDLTRGTVALNRAAVAERFVVDEVRGLSRAAGSVATSATGPSGRRRHEIEKVVYLPKSRVVSLFQSLERDDQGNRRQIELSAGPLVHAHGWDDVYTLAAMIAPENADRQTVAKASAAREQHEADLPAIAPPSGKVEKALVEKGESVEAGQPKSGGAIERMLTDLGVPLKVSPPAPMADMRQGTVESVEHHGASRNGIVEPKPGATPQPRPDDPMVAVRIVLIAPVTAPPPGEPGRLAPR